MSERPTILLQRIYLRSAKFSGAAAGKQPETLRKIPVTLRLSNNSKALEESRFEVCLQLDLQAGDPDPLFAVQLEQVGLFQIQGYRALEQQNLLKSYCPAQIFPYARETISSLISHGGFSSLLLAPINFDALYAAQMDHSANTTTTKTFQPH